MASRPDTDAKDHDCDCLDLPPLMAGGLPNQYVDTDPEETREWLDSFDGLVDQVGADPRPVPDAVA